MSKLFHCHLITRDKKTFKSLLDNHPSEFGDSHLIIVWLAKLDVSKKKEMF